MKLSAFALKEQPIAFKEMLLELGLTPDDIKAVAMPALAHRLILKPEPRIRGVLPQDIINKILAEVPVPAV